LSIGRARSENDEEAALNKALREAIAYHEAGHMIAAWRSRVKIRRATIVPAGDFYGIVDHESPLRGVRLEIDGSDRARLKAEKAILILLAGPAAQRCFRVTSWRSHHGRGDYDGARDLALRLHGSGELATAHLKWMQAQARALVAANWRFVRAFARRLLQDDTLEYRVIQEIMVTEAAVLGWQQAATDRGSRNAPKSTLANLRRQGRLRARLEAAHDGRRPSPT
jgi:hypothetical protein